MSLVTAADLRQKRAKMNEEGKAILAKAQEEGRALSAEEKVSFDKIHADMEALKATYEAIEHSDEVERDLNEARARVIVENGKPVTGEQIEEREKKYNEAFNTYLRFGTEGLDSEQRALLRSRYKADESRAQTVGTGSSGGYTVPQGFRAVIEDALLAFGGMRQVATVISTEAGNTLPMPTSNDTGNVGVLLAENTQVSNQDIAFSVVNLGAYKFSSKQVLVPIELLQDTGVDLVPFIGKKLGQRIGRAQNTYFTTGTGTSQPWGVVPAATVGYTASNGTSQVTTITYASLVELQHSVDPEYRLNARWMFADSSLKKIKQLVDGQSRPLFLPGIAVKEPDTILGQPFVINQDVAAMAASAKSIAYGDFSKFMIRDVKDITLLRLDERYADYHQVAFLAFARADSNLLDAGTHPVKLFVNAAS